MNAAYEVAVARSHLRASFGSGPAFCSFWAKALNSLLVAEAALTMDFAPEKW